MDCIFCKIIDNQIENHTPSKISRSENRTPRIVRCRKNYRKYIPLTSYQKAFFAKMYRTGQLKRKPYSQMWRYKEEAARFEKLQSQYLYLCRHNIHSIEELKNRKEDISIRMDALDDQRHQIYKRRYPHKPALALLKIIEENEIRASYYEQGSLFYASNYEKWKEAAEILVQKGYTVNQISEMKESFQAELVSVAKAKRELKKEENLVNGILSEKSRVMEIEVPYKVQEKAKESDTIQRDISIRKGGDAEKSVSDTAGIPAHTGTEHSEKQPAHGDKQRQLEEAR